MEKGRGPRVVHRHEKGSRNTLFAQKFGTTIGQKKSPLTVRVGGRSIQHSCRQELPASGSIRRRITKRGSPRIDTELQHIENEMATDQSFWVQFRPPTDISRGTVRRGAGSRMVLVGGGRFHNRWIFVRTRGFSIGRGASVGGHSVRKLAKSTWLLQPVKSFLPGTRIRGRGRPSQRSAQSR